MGEAAHENALGVVILSAAGDPLCQGLTAEDAYTDGAPGHPAVLKQEAVQMDGKKAMMTTGCPYGDREGYAQVLAYLQGLSK